MDEHEVGVLLTYCAANDARFNTPDADQAQVRIVAWHDQLANVEQRFALDHVRRFYAKHQNWPVQPGDIRTAWGHHQDVLASKARHRELTSSTPGQVVRSEETEQMLASMREQLAATAARGVPERSPSKPMRWVRDDVFAGGAGHE